MKRNLEPKIYFAHYGQMVSMYKRHAIAMVKQILEGNSYDLSKQPSSKVLKYGKTLRREKPDIKYANKWITVNHCLDWEREDWQSLLDELTKEEI